MILPVLRSNKLESGLQSGFSKLSSAVANDSAAEQKARVDFPLAPQNIDRSLFTATERQQALSTFITALDQADDKDIKALLAQAPDIYAILLNDGDYDAAEALNDRTKFWGEEFDVAKQWNENVLDTTTENTEKADTSNQAVERFNMLIGTDSFSRIDNLVTNGQLFKAVLLIEILDKKGTLSREEQQQLVDTLEAIVGLSEVSGDIVARTAAAQLLQESGTDTPGSIEASTHEGPSYDNEPQKRNLKIPTPSFG